MQRVGNYWHMLPQYAQARKSVWEAVNSKTGKRRIDEAFPDEICATKRSQDMFIRFKNGSTWQLVGSDTYNSLVGSPPVGVTASEWALADPAAWAYLRPILLENGGWALFITTVRGKNHVWRMYEGAKSDPDWFVQLLTARETGVLSEQALDKERLEYQREYGPEDGDALFAQEWMCFKPDAIVATDKGMVRIAEIQIGDAALTHTGRFRPVDKLMTRPFDGELVRIESWGSKALDMTPEHPVYVCDPLVQRYSWKQAQHVQEGDWLVTPRMSSAQSVVPPELAKVIAWYACEGCVCGNKVSFAIGAHEPELVDDLTLALVVLGYKAAARRTANVVNVVVNSVVLADFLVSQVGSLSHMKRLPLALLRGNERVVWDTMMNGDGHVRANGETVFVSTSRALVMQVQLLGSTLGYGGTYSVKAAGREVMPGGRTCATREKYTLMMRSAATGYEAKTTGTKIRAAKNGVLGKVRSVTRVQYAGPVHNIEVRGDHSYVVENRVVHNCDWNAAIVGSYYGRMMRDLETAGQITSVPYDPQALVHTAWDLGLNDQTVIWFFQVIGREIHVIDYLENSGQPLAWYAGEVHRRGYAYGEHILPHDAEAKELQTNRSRTETLRGLNLNCRVLKASGAERILVADGINAVRSVLPRCWFDAKKCDRGIEALKAYRREWDEKKKSFHDSPVHDWASDPADAFRYLALGIDAVPGTDKSGDAERFRKKRGLE